jgi:hypothetical protein
VGVIAAPVPRSATQENGMRKSVITIAAVAAASLSVLGGIAFSAQDRSTLKVPGGLSFAEFKGYQDWRIVAPSQVPGGIKVIAANDVMMRAYRAGLPANGKAFPDGSKVVKIEWAQHPNPISPYPVTIPGELMSVSFIEKDTRRFPKTHGWAYAQFLFDPATHQLKPNGTGSECGFACHTKVAAVDYIFTAYPPR